ncbi:MAG TPA: hypothetical protein VF085_11310 [Solirubrobacterales bacterium]
MLVVVGTAADRATGSDARRCRDVVIRNYDGTVYTRTYDLAAAGIGCPLARAVAHSVLVDDGAEAPRDPHRFTCSRSAAGVVCRREEARIRWSYRPHRRVQ